MNFDLGKTKLKITVAKEEAFHTIDNNMLAFYLLLLPIYTVFLSIREVQITFSNMNKDVPSPGHYRPLPESVPKFKEAPRNPVNPSIPSKWETRRMANSDSRDGFGSRDTRFTNKMVFFY